MAHPAAKSTAAVPAAKSTATKSTAATVSSASASSSAAARCCAQRRAEHEHADRHQCDCRPAQHDPRPSLLAGSSPAVSAPARSRLPVMRPERIIRSRDGDLVELTNRRQKSQITNELLYDAHVSFETREL
jgi:hypothetical protein